MQLYGHTITVAHVALVVSVLGAAFGARSMFLAKRREQRELDQQSRKQKKQRLKVYEVLWAAAPLAEYPPATYMEVDSEVVRPHLTALVKKLDEISVEDLPEVIQRVIAQLREHCLVLSAAQILSPKDKRFSHHVVLSNLDSLHLYAAEVGKELNTTRGDTPDFFWLVQESQELNFENSTRRMEVLERKVDALFKRDQGDTKPPVQ